ncbi:uncharacterized protein LOC143378844 [Andrena cerasifolii]|uniref:uncharacterized protein LOC143378844 n=1 Tax=Andrena cerasifolii TaxID=2819439 RepID=UPI0040382D60
MLSAVAGMKDYFVPNKNRTMQRIYIYPAYYPFDEEKYCIYFWTHMALVICTVAVVYTACDTLYMYGVQHACGLLAVAGYRFKSAVENLDYDEMKSDKAMNLTYRKVCISVHGYKHALSFIQDIHELHSTYLAAMVILVIAAFSITLVKTSITDVGFEFYKYLGFLVIQLIHLFFLTCQGQFVQNAYDDIYDDMYAGRWYNSSPKTQMLYLLALRGTLTAPALTAGGLLPLTLETFAEVLKASVSYFTVLKST